jgi:hypothetical protein
MADRTARGCLLNGAQDSDDGRLRRPSSASSAPRSSCRGTALLAAAGLLCGGCALLPRSPASPAPASQPADPATPATLRPAAAAPPLASILPFPPARLQAAAALAARFTTAWDTWSWRQSPATWLAILRPMAASSLYPALAQAASTPALLAQRTAARQTAAATASAPQIRDLTPGSVTITITIRQVITATSGTSQSTASYAITLTPGGGWSVWDIEPATAGNS